MPLFSRNLVHYKQNIFRNKATCISNRGFSMSPNAPWSILSRLGRFDTSLVHESILAIKNVFLEVKGLGALELRRINNISHLYRRLCENKKILESFQSISKNFRIPKYALAGAIISNSTSYNWKKDKPDDEDLAKYYKEIDICNEIRKQTLLCKKCGNRLRIEETNPNTTYCTCPNAPSSVYGKTVDGCDWKPFLERGDIIVWRREHATLAGMWEYKMYGSFDDVTADEFLSVQLDISDFRLSWDKSTAQCNILDRDSESSGIVYYWEVNWPRFFSNRDYCCYREHSVDDESGTMLVISKSTEHPACPSKRKVWRVKDYTSIMTIRPHTTSDKPGLEFCITGFENPGVQLPEAIITWVAIRGMPEFMMNLREACLKLRKSKQSFPVKESKGCYQDNYNSGMHQSQTIYA